MNNKRPNILHLTISAICLALALLLPFITGQIPEIGSMLCPMHIPVLLCGFVCGPMYGAAVGFLAPLVRFALFGMPPIMPTGIAMCIELCVYGLVSGLTYKRLPAFKGRLYVSLLAAMLLGRIAWGCMRVILMGLTDSAFTWTAFMAGAFTNALPGIIVQLILIPVIVKALEKALPALQRK